MDLRKRWLQLIDGTLNKVTVRLARTGHGPISLVRHRGRKTGRIYETPIIVAPVEGGFMCELTYGDQVSWYRNLVAAGEGDVLYRGVWHHVDAIETRTAAEGYAAYRGPAGVVLRLLGREQFRFLHRADGGASTN